jgi:hypothetical protein
MSSSASESSTANRAADVVSLLAGLFVAAMVGYAVVVQQRTALEQCAPSCDLRGLIIAQAETIVMAPVTLATITVGPVPVGAVALLLLVGFIMIYAVDPPRF